MRRLLIVFSTLAIVGCAPQQNGLRVTGQIEGIVVNAGSRIGGRVLEVPVEEGQRVAKGDVLLRLDDADAQAVVAAAKANLAKAEAALSKLKTGATAEQLRQAEAAAEAARQQYTMALNGARAEEVAAARALAAAARAQRDTAQQEYARIEGLFSQEAVSKSQFDQARGARDAASAQYNAASEKEAMAVKGARSEELAMAKANADRAQAALDEVRLGARVEDIALAQAARDAAAADVQRAETALREMVVTAPMDGIVESLDVRAGDIIKPGPIVRMVDPEDLELVVYLGADHLGQVALGGRVPLTTDAYGDELFEGTIKYIAQQGEFTPRNLQTEEERVQQVFAVKLKLGSAKGRLRAGMSATAHFDEAAVPAATK